MSQDNSLADISGDRRAERVYTEFVDVAEYFLMQALIAMDDQAVATEDELRAEVRSVANCRQNDISAAIERLLENGDLQAHRANAFRLSKTGRKRRQLPDFGIAQGGNPWRLLERQRKFRDALKKAGGRHGIAP